MRGPKTELMKKVDQYCRGCKAEVYAGICRPWLYLTFQSGGMLVTARVNLEGGLLGPLVYWIRSLVSLPKIMGASDQDRSLFDDLCEGSHEGLVERSGKHERSGHDTKRSIVTREFGNPLARPMRQSGR